VKRAYYILVLSVVFVWAQARAQKPFTEGRIVYKVKVTGAGGKVVSGTYVFTFKENNLRKELNLPDYQEVTLVNTAKGTAYALRTLRDKKFAIQLSLDDIHESQARYSGFRETDRQGKLKKIAGLSGTRATIVYSDGTESDIYLSREWYPEITYTYEQFPAVHFLPLSFTYKSAEGPVMEFVADEVTASNVDNSAFVIPQDYKLVSNSEYKKLK
jgi:hypothetical protein